MSKKLKYIFGAILSLMILGGCKEEMPSLGEVSSEGTTSSADTSAAVTTAVPAKAEKETETEKNSPNNDQASLEKVILKAGNYYKDKNKGNAVRPLLYGDLDGDGVNELIATYGRYIDYSAIDDGTFFDGDKYGDIWFASGNSAVRLTDRYINLIDTQKIGDVLYTEKVNGCTILVYINMIHTTSKVEEVRLFEISESSLRELEISGKFTGLSEVENGVYTVISEAYDYYGTGDGYTEKPYWFYFENGEFKEYVGKNITKADFMKYSGGKAAVDKIEAEGGNITGIIYRKNNIVNINYTAKSEYFDEIVNKFRNFDVSGETCRELDSGNGVYLLSTIDPFSDLPEEQLALHKLIIEASEKENAEIINPIFGDFDGDGKNEVIAILGEVDDFFGEQGSGEVWLATGDKAELIMSRGQWLAPKIVTSCGKTFIKMEDCAFATSSISTYFLLKDSSASRYFGVPGGQGVYPYGEFGDFTAVHDAYDMSVEWDKSDEDAHPLGMGHTWKTYWYYAMDGESYEYAGREITKEDFLKYNGAKAILDKAAIDEREIKWEVKNIIKRGNGIITVNLTNTRETEDYFAESYSNKILKYRNGKLFDITENYDDGGNYGYKEDTKQTDFERFSEMIYDTAEGDENSFIRERFYGDADKDGKNELYAYYGTDGNFSLWFADDSGAKKVTEDISLFYADGDALMKNGDGYFVIKNGKSKKLDTFKTWGAEDFSMQADGSFTGYVSAGYTDSTRSEETKKLYWFRYRDGKFSDYTGTDITEEEFLQYGGGRAALDEIAARGGDLVNIVRRENGIININYALHNQTTTQRFFMTLEIGADNKLTDITPKKEDGTPDNQGWYLHSLKIGE